MTTEVNDIQQVVREIVDEMHARTDRGTVASYIPELACVDPQAFGLAVVDRHGNVARRGRLRRQVFHPEHLQGIHADPRPRTRRRRLVAARRPEPSGSPFNSIVQLERERGVPRNPFINAGAIAVTDVDPVRGTPAT